MGAGRTDGLIKNFGAGGAIPARRYVKFAGTDNDIVVLAVAATDDIIGVSIDLDAAQGERVDVALGGLVEVTAGGVIDRGKLVVSDAQGRAVNAAPAVGANVRHGGQALGSHVLGDVAVVNFFPGSLQG